MKKINLIVGIILFTIQTFSQDFTGKITYEVDYDLPEAMEPQRSMLPTEMITKIGKQHSKIIQNTMMGEQVTIFNVKTKMTTSLFNLMGQKIALEINTANEENENKPEIEYLDETKTIAGYECKKALFTINTTSADGVDDKMTMEVFYSTEISAKSNQQFSQLKGLPLQYSINTQGMVMNLIAKEIVKEKYGKNEFEIPSGYEKMTLEDFQKMMGQ